MSQHQELHIAIAQCNFSVGDIDGNVARILKCHKQAETEKADIVVFSELSITGYPPEDLLLRPAL